MGLIKKRFWSIVLFFLFANPLFSQSGMLLAAEASSIEKKLSDPKLAPAERKNALENLARLYELSGNAEGSAEAWKEAAIAVPGKTDLGNLLKSAQYLAAMGEFDRAFALLQPVLASGDRSLLTRARLVAAQMEALKTGTTVVLETLLSNPDFAVHKPALYYTIWKISEDTAVRTRMLSRLDAEFPQSPEARIIRDDKAVSAAPAVFWLLSGLEYGARTGSVPAVLAVENSQAVGQSGMLQTGVFGRQENARLQAERLRKAGFNPAVTKKTVNGKVHWMVVVSSGTDPSRTMQLLKDKGFDSFPVN